MTLAKNVMLDISATAVALFSKRLKLQMSNGVLIVQLYMICANIKSHLKRIF